MGVCSEQIGSNIGLNRGERQSTDEVLDRIQAWFGERSNEWAAVREICDGTGINSNRFHYCVSVFSGLLERRGYGRSSRYRMHLGENPLESHIVQRHVAAKPKKKPATHAKPPERNIVVGTVNGLAFGRESHDGMPHDLALQVGMMVAIELAGANPAGAHQAIDRQWADFRESQRLLSSKEIMEMHVSKLGLKSRTVNMLESDLIFTLKDLLSCTRDRLLRITNFGELCFEECKAIAGCWKRMYEIALQREAKESKSVYENELSRKGIGKHESVANVGL